MYSTYSLLGLKVITLFVERFWMNFSCCVDCGWRGETVDQHNLAGPSCWKGSPLVADP